MKYVFQTATFEGTGEFTYDMLRYDGCYPWHQEDVLQMITRAYPFGALRRVTVARRVPYGQMWTKDRWESFGWKLVANSTDSWS